MSSKKDTVDYIVGQIQDAGNVYARKMFGEYGVYCDEKMVALVCDDQLFIKPTQAGRDFLREVEEAPPYPGAKNWFLLPEDDWDDALRLTELIRVTLPEVPLPQKKPRKAKPSRQG